MGGKIPRPIRHQVIKSWLDAKSRDTIAKELQISTGAVSGIIKDFTKDDPEFDLLREVALKIKSLNMDIQSFAPLVRVYEVLRENHESLQPICNGIHALSYFCDFLYIVCIV